MITLFDHRPRFSLLIVLIFSSALFSCAANRSTTTWDGPEPESDVAEIMHRITHGDGSVLDMLEPDRPFVDMLRGHDDSWPYILARAYEARGLSESARLVYRQEIDRGETPWNGRSALRLARLAADDQRWLIAEGYARRGVEFFPTGRDLWYRYGEALYRQDRFGDLLGLTADVPRFVVADGDERGQGENVAPLSLETERLLWRAVAAWEEGRDGPDRFMEAFIAVPAHQIHSRLYLYLYYRDSSLSAFSDNERRLLEAVYRTVSNEHQEARRLFRLIDPEWFAHRLRGAVEDELDVEHLANGMPSLLSSVSRAAGNGDAALTDWLQRVGESLQDYPDLEPSVLVVRSRYAEAGNQRAEALRLLAEAIGSSRDDLIRDWVQMAIRFSEPLPTVLERLEEWNAADAEYALAVDRLLPVMIRERRWQEVEAVYASLPDHAVTTRAQVGVVTVLLDRDGHLSTSRPAERLREALELPPTRYYGLVARRLAEERVTVPEEVASAGDYSVPAEHAHVRALLAAGLVEPARNRAMAIALDPQNAEASLELARRFYAQGYPSPALDLARRAVSRGELSLDQTMLPLLYPRPYPAEIRAAAEEYRVSSAVLYGLIREESHFNPRARSPVGAVGLAQVMPATADDLVRRLGWTSADLESVADSVRMGAFYLDHLAGLFPESTILQLAAYNAGPGRSRTWNSTFGDLSPELQVEALPFIETRWYLRRIAVSSAWYYVLAEGGDPAVEIPLFKDSGS